jgi:predicted AlkP superfamily pyrophosphatase or phosphodiesterase
MRACGAVLAAAVACGAAVVPIVPVEQRPKLVVVLVVDQMRADYIERFAHEWRGGLHRLLTDGAWFREAAYPYLDTVTCPGHATIATGAFPRAHGVIQNAWWDRREGRAITCTEDAAARNIGYGIAPKGGDSAHMLAVPTLADELRWQRGAHVVSVSLKDRSAIMLAGHGGDAITWMSGELNGWITSTAFSAAPVPAVRDFIEANPIDKDYGKVWTPLLAEPAYKEADAGIGESPPAGWTRTFPHALLSAAGQPDETFRALWQRSPYADAVLGRFAATIAESMALGRHEGTDFLGVSFSAPDLVGHAFGPSSLEIHDIYARLDVTIGELLSALDRSVGRDRYVVALTGDHGVSEIPERAAADGQNGGRISSRAIVDLAERRLGATLGSGKYVAGMVGNDLYFQPGVYQKLKESSGTLLYLLGALSRIVGVSRVFRAEQLERYSTAADPELRAAALSYKSGRSGDLVFVFKPGWMLASSGTTHGSASRDDQRVPILLMGAGIRRGEFSASATPADIAPTLAALCGVTLPQAEGRPLREAIIETPTTQARVR